MAEDHGQVFEFAEKPEYDAVASREWGWAGEDAMYRHYILAGHQCDYEPHRRQHERPDNGSDLLVNAKEDGRMYRVQVLRLTPPFGEIASLDGFKYTLERKDRIGLIFHACSEFDRATRLGTRPKIGVILNAPMEIGMTFWIPDQGQEVTSGWRRFKHRNQGRNNELMDHWEVPFEVMQEFEVLK